MDTELALQKTEAFLRGWYEESAPFETVLADADPVEFSAIGEGSRMFFDSLESVRKWWTREHMDQRPSRRLTGLTSSAVPLKDAALVLARWQYAEGTVMRRQRATFLWTAPFGRLRLVHLHISQPWEILWGRENFPVTVGRMNYEYVTGTLEDEENTPLPRVPARQLRVLRCLRDGMTYEETGELLSLSPRTVRYYVNELIHRFRVENRAQLIAASERLEAGMPRGEREEQP